MSADEPEIPEDSAAKVEAGKPRRERISLAKLSRSKRPRSRLGLEPIDPADQAMFGGYVGSKAGTLHKIGIEKYRAEDFFDMPSEQFDDEQLDGVRSGCEQLTAGKGLAPETPLEGVTVRGCYALIHTLHFEVIDRHTSYLGEGCLDELRCRHRVSTTQGSLFNRVVYPDDEA